MKKKNFILRINFLPQLILVLLLVTMTDIHGQANKGEIEVTAGSSFLVNPQGVDENLPFWLHANRDGMVDQSHANFFGYLSGAGVYDLNKNFSLSGGARIYSQNNYLNKTYVKLQGYNFILSAGKFIDPLAEKENELSTGSFMYSHNASPLPKVALYTDGFQDVPGTKGLFKYKGLFAHGWFGEDRYVNNAYLHEKYFYLSLNYDFLEATAGIVHNVQWAGTNIDGNKLPSGWGTFKEVVLANGSSNPNAPGGEQSNAVGNSVAAYDFGLNLDFEKVEIKTYRVFYLEDKVSTRFRSPWDGIWGLSIKPKSGKLVQNVLWEHINTKKQDSFGYEPYGTARYYNNFVYRTGWTYKGRVIGNPMLLTDGSKGKNSYPVFNNIIIAHHFGFSGALDTHLNYKVLYTFSRNYGNFQDQIIERYPNSECPRPATTCGELRPLSELKQVSHSILLELNAKLPQNDRFSYGVGLAADLGELYENRIGIMLNLEYSLFSTFKEKESN